MTNSGDTFYGKNPGRWMRFLAFTQDYLLSGIIAYVSLAFLSMASFISVSIEDLVLPMAQSIIVVPLLILAPIAPYLISYYLWSASPAKRLRDMKVIATSSRKPIGLVRSIIRDGLLVLTVVTPFILGASLNLAGISDTISKNVTLITLSLTYFVLVVFPFIDKKKRALHDYLSGSEVVYYDYSGNNSGSILGRISSPLGASVYFLVLLSGSILIYTFG